MMFPALHTTSRLCVQGDVWSIFHVTTFLLPFTWLFLFFLSFAQ